MEYRQRIAKLNQQINALGLDAYLVQKNVNCRYLSGFTGSEGTLLIGPEENYLLVDFRYRRQAEQQVSHCKVIEFQNNYYAVLEEILLKEQAVKLGFEADYLTYQIYQSLQEKIKNLKMIPASGLVEKIRQTKDEQEIALICRAVAIADAAYENVLQKIKPGITEKDVALELEYFMRSQGAESLSFETIVASGSRGALPHGIASDKELQRGELVVMDFGCSYRGYCSDITRTIALGKISSRQQEIYNIVLDAQGKAIKGLKPGITGKEGDQLARDVIAAAGFDRFFGHGLGHGVGMEVHEKPRLSPSYEETIDVDSIVTVEPGIYLDDWGGVRIEDMIQLVPEGVKVLTEAPKELQVLDF